MPVLLLFNIPPQKRAKIQVSALQLGCRVRPVPPEHFGAALEKILAGEAETCPAEGAFAEELLVMCGLSERQLDTLLTELRRRKISVALKAVLTPTNAAWTARELYEELCRERAAFAAGRQAHI